MISVDPCNLLDNKKITSNDNMSVKKAFYELMGRNYHCLTTYHWDHLIYSFFKAVKKGKDTENLQLAMKKWHPVNQHCVLKQGILFAKKNNQSSTGDLLAKKLFALELLNGLPSGKDKLKFNESLEDRDLLVKIAFTVAFLFVTVSFAYSIIHKFNSLKREINYLNNNNKYYIKKLFCKNDSYIRQSNCTNEFCMRNKFSESITHEQCEKKIRTIQETNFKLHMRFNS